jgi:hypothetical protein
MVFGVGAGVGVGVGVGAGVDPGTDRMTTVPADRLASLWSLARAVKATGCIPIGRVPDQLNVTPVPQSPPAWRVIACPSSPNVTVTRSAGEAVALWYATETWIVVVVVPPRGETVAPDSCVGLAADASGAATRTASTRPAANAETHDRTARAVP